MESKAEQYYPTYRFDKEHRDVVLAELETALVIANDQTKHYGVMANVLVAVLAIATPALLQFEDPDRILTLLHEYPFIGLGLLSAISLVLLRYFSELQKQIVFNARKVVTLRLLLGLDYGSIHLTLPNWRVEGATNPFEIRLFHGWLSFGAVPYWTLLIFDVWAYWFTLDGTGIPPWPFIIIWTVIISWYFRFILLDRHETTRLMFIKTFASLLGVQLVDNFEYIFYRAKLAVIELERLKVDYSAMRSILINIEDRRYYVHGGVDWRGLVRAVLSRFMFLRKKFGYIRSGGSTISMQLARTLLIVHGQPAWKRKILELLLAPWLVDQFSKPELLNMHIACVRYGTGIMGLTKALKHYFGSIKGHQLSPEEAFLLVERLSNISGKVDIPRVDHLIARAGVPLDQNLVHNLYQSMP